MLPCQKVMMLMMMMMRPELLVSSTSVSQSLRPLLSLPGRSSFEKHVEENDDDDDDGHEEDENGVD